MNTAENDDNFANFYFTENLEKFVKVCLHYSYAVQISIQFDEIFEKK